MLFTAQAHAGLASGAITLTFRTWKRAQVKVGGRYRVGPVVVEVDRLERVPMSSVTDADARRAGDVSLDALRHRLGHPDDDATVWRVDFHRVDAPAPEPPSLDVDEIVTRLERMDRAASSGPWTFAALDLIGRQPAVVSTRLAEQLGRERMPFKADVRKLKRLGLTESLEIGYRLTPLGRLVLERHRPSDDVPDVTAPTRDCGTDPGVRSGRR